MPKSIKDLVISLAAKAGVNVEDEAFVNAINAPDYERLTVPDEVFTGIDNGLLSLAAAKGHPDIKAHVMAMAYDGLDKEVNNAGAEFKLGEEELAQLKSERSSTKRAVLLARLAAAKEAKKYSAGNADKEKYARIESELNEQIRALKEGEAGIRSEYEKKLRDKDMGFAKGRLLSDYKTIHDHLPSNIKQQIIDAQLNEALRENNATLDIDASGNLTLVRADGNPVYSANNTPYTPKAFIDKVLSDNKQLKINDQPAPAANGANRQTYNTPGQAPAQNFVPGKAANSTAQRLNEQAIADLERSSASSMV